MTLRVLIFALLLAPVGWSQDWPQLLGPSRNGTYTGPFNPQAKFTQIWKKSIGEGFSPPAVAGSRVIVFHRKGANEIIESLDAATGASQWTFAYPTAYRDDFGFSDGPRAVPLIDGDFVYTYGADATLTCVELRTGKKVWSLDSKKEFGVRKEYFGAAISPMIDGDKLMMNIGGANGAGIIALNKTTGKTIWKVLNTEAGYASPTMATINGEKHALFFTREGIVDIDPANGRIRFQLRWRARSATTVNAATPIVSGNQVFVSASYGTGAVLLTINGDTAKEVWSGDESLSNHYATSVLKSGYLYGYHGRQDIETQEFRCIDWKTGKVKWSIKGFGAGSVTLAGDHLLLLKEDGNLVVMPATPDAAPNPIKTLKISASPIRSFPALANGRLLIRTLSNELIALQTTQ